ncbi:helix-turn-helix domain-containing protein [Geminicoccus sp.]|uniref:helix-turn-helix domain-containing protein n=1 Tax=Geminicoccus sp. TaxID=2024832 RepID=UPI0032C241A9
MARVALAWGVRDLAQRANVAPSTINRFEMGRVVPNAATLGAIQRSLEAAGIEFISENGGGPGLRIRKST